MDKMKKLFSARHLTLALAPVENGTVNLDGHKVINIFEYDCDSNQYDYLKLLRKVIENEVGGNILEMEESFYDGFFDIIVDGRKYVMAAQKNLCPDDEGYYYITGCSNVYVSSVENPKRGTYVNIGATSQYENKRKGMIDGGKTVRDSIYGTVIRRGISPEFAELFGIDPTPDEVEVTEGRIESKRNDGEVAVVETKKYHWEKNMSFYYAYPQGNTMLLSKLTSEQLEEKMNARLSRTKEQRIIDLYTEDDMRIVDIADKIDVSTSTIYQVLKRHGISKKSVDNTEFKAVISFDKEAAEVIKKVNPNGLSKWICDLIKNNKNML